ncbi:hypothetical protein V6Z92_005793 [Aspergillus fumigatus]
MRDIGANADSADSPSTPLKSPRPLSNPLQDQALPSVECTSSCSPSSAGRLTPVSSVDDSLDHQVERSSLTPNTQSLFQNLRLSEAMRHPNHSSQTDPSSGPRESGLTPHSHHTTYRDLYNATPSPGGASFTEPSQQRQPPTPSSPLAAVGSSRSQNLHPADSGDTAATDADRDNEPEPHEDSLQNNNRESNNNNEDFLYNIRQEELPPVPIYDIRLQIALRRVRGKLVDLAQVMNRRELAQDPTTTFHKLYNETLEASRFAYPATRTVGFIGDSGMGKSSLINSILDQGGLARSNGDGAACTTVVTEFRSVNAEHPHNYTIEADFMDHAEIRELLEELLSSVRKYYTDAYREVRDATEQEDIKAAARRAWDTLLSLFPNQPALDLDFLSRDGEDAVESIVTTLEEWARAGLDHRPGGRDSLRYSVVARHADECMEQLDYLTADSREGDRPALWPFVNDVDATETARASSADDARYILDLDSRIQDLAQRIRQIRSRRRQTSGSRSQHLAAEQLALSNEKEKLEFELKRFLIVRRNKRIAESLLQATENQARVFCVSNTLYKDYRANDHEQANEYLELSGIRELRRYCQSVPAEAQLRATESFLQNQVPALLGSLTQWALAGSDAVPVGQADVLRDVLNEAEQTLQRVR